MEMALATRCTPQLPLFIRDSARARGRLLMTHGDCHPRQDNQQQGVPPLRLRFRASAARGAGSSTPKKSLLLQHSSARAQPRLFCSLADCIMEEEQDGPENGTVSFAVATNRLQEAMAANHRQQMLDAFGALKVFAGNKNYYEVEYKATDLALTAVSPLAHLSSSAGGKHGLDDDVVKESLAVACLLLRNAPANIRATLCSEIWQVKGVKTSLERIRGSGGSASDPDDEARKLADEILAQLPSASAN